MTQRTKTKMESRASLSITLKTGRASPISVGAQRTGLSDKSLNKRANIISRIVTQYRQEAPCRSRRSAVPVDLNNNRACALASSLAFELSPPPAPYN